MTFTTQWTGAPFLSASLGSTSAEALANSVGAAAMMRGKFFRCIRRAR
jgi:hypothetical protein